jgi:hypothetical protein
MKTEIDMSKMREKYFEKYPEDKAAFDSGIISNAIDRRVRKFFRENGIPTARELGVVSPMSNLCQKNSNHSIISATLSHLCFDCPHERTCGQPPHPKHPSTKGGDR